MQDGLDGSIYGIWTEYNTNIIFSRALTEMEISATL